MKLGSRERAAMLAGLLLGISAAGCTRPHETDDERLRRQAAEGARQLREDARTAAVEARKEVRAAERQVRDIAVGVKEGWKEGDPPPGSPAAGSPSRDAQVDINRASVAQLSTLPGVSHEMARKIVHKRPYTKTDELVTGKLLTQDQYNRLAGRLAVR